METVYQDLALIDTLYIIKNLLLSRKRNILFYKKREARATTFGKKIIILDEPTAASGVRESRHILKIIKSLKDKGLSIIIITHNLEHAFYISDTFFMLRNRISAGVKKKDETSVDKVVKMITGGVFVK